MVELLDLVGFIATLLNALLYPLNSLLRMFWGWVMIIINSVFSLYSALVNFFSIITNFILTISDVMFPGSWGNLILIGLGIVFALRVYSFLKDVEIFGFKL